MGGDNRSARGAYVLADAKVASPDVIL